MDITGNEKTKTYLTITGRLSSIPIDVADADDNVVFKVEDTANGPRGLYVLQGNGEFVLLQTVESMRHSEVIGDGSSTVYTVTHNLNTRDVTVEVYEDSGLYRTILADVARPTPDSITITFRSTDIPAVNEYRVIVKA